MTYFKFFNKTKKYLNSVKIIKNYVGVELIFSSRWVIPKSYGDIVEIIKSDNSDSENTILTFFAPFDEEEKINDMESAIDGIIKYNLEKEEKENLFKDKVQELKIIFESQKLNELKDLKFDITNINTILDDDGQSTEGDTERDGEYEERESREQVQPQ